MKTIVFAHKGIIGIQSSVDCEGLFNDPTKPGELGFVVNAEFVRFQPEALELLKKIKRSGDDIGDVDIFESGIEVIFCWLGGPLSMIDPDEVTGSSSYDPELITQVDKNVQTPQEFIDFVEKYLEDKRV